jgi:futalosine hydrolase
VEILIVSATELELAPYAADLRAHPRHQIEILVTGVGMVATAVSCARALSGRRYDVALNLGVCGSFDATLAPGTVVHVVSDRLSELGAEDGEGFLTIDDLGLGQQAIVNQRPPVSEALRALPAVAGITVNTVHGNDRSIAAVLGRIRSATLGGPVETMEGAAFMYACAVSAVPYAQVRAVSNAVERRNRAAWKMETAIRNLGAAAIRILDTLS